jgi:hypothetical protein
LIACHTRQPFAACAGGRTDLCGPEHSFLYWYEYVHWRVSWPRMASGNIICNYEYFYLWHHQGREFIANGALENGAFCTVFSENFHKF